MREILLLRVQWIRSASIPTPMILNKTLIPDEIVTVEQLAAWALSILGRTSISQRYQEVENGPIEQSA